MRQNNFLVDTLIIWIKNDFFADFRERADENILSAFQNFKNNAFAPPAICISDFNFNFIAVQSSAQVFSGNKNIGAAIFGRDEAKAFNVDAQLADKSANFAVASAVIVPSAVSTVERIVIIFFL